MKRTVLAVAVGLITLGGCSSAPAEEPRSPLCEQFCDDLQTYDALRCTSPEVDTCAGELTEKQLLAGRVDDAAGEQEYSDTVSQIHAKVEAIVAAGGAYGRADCFESGANLGDRLYDCRESAAEFDDRFGELYELVRGS